MQISTTKITSLQAFQKLTVMAQKRLRKYLQIQSVAMVKANTLIRLLKCFPTQKFNSDYICWWLFFRIFLEHAPTDMADPMDNMVNDDNQLHKATQIKSRSRNKRYIRNCIETYNSALSCQLQCCFQCYIIVRFHNSADE